MKKLKDILNIPENEIRDDDHLDREDITEDEFQGALSELAAKYKDMKPTISKKQLDEINQETLRALNSEDNG